MEDVCYVTCEKTKIRCVLQYLGDGWLGKAKHRVEGAIYRYENDGTDHYEKIKDIPAKKILAKIDGSWMSQIYYTLTGSSVRPPSCHSPLPAHPLTPLQQDRHLLIDLSPLHPVPKLTPPSDLQASNESRMVWKAVTDAINRKDYGEATRLKVEVEERQRQLAKERESRGEIWRSQWFEDMEEGHLGRPRLREVGRGVLEGVEGGDWKLPVVEEEAGKDVPAAGEAPKANGTV